MGGGAIEPAKGAESAIQKQREIQRRAERALEERSVAPAGGGALQAGPRVYPAPQFPAQDQQKPGAEARTEPAPMRDAPYYKGSEKLLDRTALITGGDSGIGRAVAVLFAREGADVAIAYCDADEAAEDTKAAVEREGRRAMLIKGDVADPAFAPAAVEHTLQTLGGLDILVNNAAFRAHAPGDDLLSLEHFDRALKTSVYGYFYMAKAALPHLKPGSAIINTGSDIGLFGASELLDYSTTKGGIHAFTRSLAALLVDKGIRVNCVATGPVWTAPSPADRNGGQVARFGARTLMKRPAQPEEIAPAYVFFASAQTSSYITGEILPILGGPVGPG
jgi:NAD(P)-dependent dehydrogenase (short-subunit alcohol dehydrogenase family)